MGYKRTERMGELLREEISQILLRGAKDPRIGMISLTAVKVSGDFSNAKVYFVVNGGEEEKRRCLEGLKSARGFIRRELRKRLTVKTIPEVDFCYDDSLDYGDRIETLLRSIKSETT